MTYPERPLLHLLTRTSLVGQIIVGLIAGLLLASFFPAAALKVGFIGKVFVSASPRAWCWPAIRARCRLRAASPRCSSPCC